LGLGTIDHLEPLKTSEKLRNCRSWFMDKPTARQKLDDVHETPSRASIPVGVGLGTIDQEVPLNVSTRVFRALVVPNAPTATQKSDDTHEVDASVDVEPGGLGVEATAHADEEAVAGDVPIRTAPRPEPSKSTGPLSLNAACLARSLTFLLHMLLRRALPDASCFRTMISCTEPPNSGRTPGW
jgi:hypothetical protein